MEYKKLQFGMVGGGSNGNIGHSHRRGAALDSLAVLSAGCFTRDPERNRADGLQWGVAEDRIYSDYRQMAEMEGKREDGIDFVIIVTHNNTHYEITKTFLEQGINVSCEKPFTMTSAEAEELCALAEEKGLELCVTFTYAHYPMIRQAKKLVEEGMIGEIIEVSALYQQDWSMLGRAHDPANYANWMRDPKKSGESNVTGSMGVHTWYLVRAITGLELTGVLAQFGFFPHDVKLESSSRILTKYTGDVPGMMWTTSTSAGHDCSIDIRINGSKGGLEWTHNDPTRLRVALVDEPVRIYTCERDYLYPESQGMSRLPAGHPEGFYEAFANIYRAFATHLLDKKNGVSGGPYYYPNGKDGLAGVRFVEASLQSHRGGNVWVDLPK